MAEGIRLKKISENLRILEEKMQTLFTECHSHIEDRLQQVTDEYNTKIEVLARQLYEMQIEKKQRYEALQIETARRQRL